MGNYILYRHMKFFALLAVVAAHHHHEELHHHHETKLHHHHENLHHHHETAHHHHHELWGYHQRIALRKWAAFFKYADTNKTGALTWYEFWNAIHKIGHAKGYSHAAIMKWKAYFWKYFNHFARGGLIRWKDVCREIAYHVKH